MEPSDQTPGSSGFQTTHWSRVLTAAQADDPGSAAAWSQLCRDYWYPIYAFLRRSGQGVQDSEDLTQGFFLRLAEKDLLTGIEPSGRFRSYLLKVLKHHVSDQRRHDQAQKRGGGQVPVAFDALDAERRYRFEPVDHWSADRLFERRWATAVLECVTERLRSEREVAGQGGLFTALLPSLIGSDRLDTYGRIGQRFGISDGAVKAAVHRLRRRFGELLRAEVLRLVADPAEVDDEIRQLILAGTPDTEISGNLSGTDSHEGV